MIYTVTLDPTLDYVVKIEHFALGGVDRTIRENIFYGDEGINVSALLVNLGYRNTALGFVASFTGQEIEQGVKSLGFDPDFIQVEKGMSRINVKLESDQESEINDMGPGITADDVDQLSGKLSYLKKEDVLVLFGSIPATVDNDIYQRTMERLNGGGIRMVVDAEKDLLPKVLRYRPFLIKPDNHELGQMLGLELETEEEIILHARKLKEQGAVNVLASMAESGAILITEDGSVHRRQATRGTVKNSVRAEGSMVAGFVAGYLEKGDYAYALKLGAACGGTMAFSDGTGTRDEIMRLSNTLQPVRKGAFIRITELLKKGSTELGVKVPDKEEAVDRLVSLIDARGRLKDTAGYKEGILAREALDSTAVSEGIAILHARAEAVEEPGPAVMVVPEGVDYGTFDGSLANPLFVVATPAKGADVHLEALSRLSTLLVNPGFKEGLMEAADKGEFLRIIDEAETEHSGAPEGRAAKDAKADIEADASSGYRVLAVTACPTGTARTYMAAENLESTGKKLGIALRAETSDSSEAQNVLIREEIAAADAIITATDKNVEMTRFDRKLVIIVPVADGIHKTGELVKRAVDGAVSVCHHTGTAGRESVSEGNGGIGRTVYKHLMSGVSHMLLFVIGGGILIALVFLFNDYSINPASFGENTPLAAYLETVDEQTLGVVLPILTGFIVVSIADRPSLAVGLVAGLTTKMKSIFVNPAGSDVNAGFLGALFTGFVGGYIVVGLRKLSSKLPESLEGIKPVSLYSVIGIFLTAVAATLINPYMGIINDGLTHFLDGMDGASRVVLRVVLGGIMSIDIGGPFNKAAYVFGATQLAKGNFKVMATVMADGMVPPIAIALCTTFFKSKFTERGRQPGVVNYIMGLSFITEGVIPFATQDPLCVIPSCIIGSVIAERLSMAFGCALRTPHGGIFVLPTAGNHLIYLATVVAGAVAGCVVLGMLKKDTAQQRDNKICDATDGRGVLSHNNVGI